MAFICLGLDCIEGASKWLYHPEAQLAIAVNGDGETTDQIRLCSDTCKGGMESVKEMIESHLRKPKKHESHYTH